eukprot:TRINITY_DN10153_c0_g1_i3.p5 TRINITY_DN10153_c0_g1~~TRINITY_DN10153_c0_g1_i3.p5  ORF type:complete len:192 (-),score=39.50 TRINITY_DN10153_c0_g1_i3:260-835(-)
MQSNANNATEDKYITKNPSGNGKSSKKGYGKPPPSNFITNIHTKYPDANKKLKILDRNEKVRGLENNKSSHKTREFRECTAKSSHGGRAISPPSTNFAVTNSKVQYNIVTRFVSGNNAHAMSSVMTVMKLLLELRNKVQVMQSSSQNVCSVKEQYVRQRKNQPKFVDPGRACAAGVKCHSHTPMKMTAQLQ